MVPKSDFPNIDWANEDVRRLVETFSEKFDAMTGEKNRVIDQQAEEIKQLKQEIASLKAAGRRSRRSRSYNARKFKDYPRPEDRSRRRRPEDIGRDGACARTISAAADIKYCPVHGTPLSESGVKTGRTVDGAWTTIKWDVARRYCTACGRQHSAAPEGVLPGEHFGTNIMSQACCMRCLAIPHEKIQRIIHMLYGRFIETL